MINLTGFRIKNFNIFNFSFKNSKNKISESYSRKVPKENTKVEFKDVKTLLGGYSLHKIREINSDVNAYFFIQKTPGTSWHLIAPVIQLRGSKKIYQYGIRHFTLEGCGGGLSNMTTLLCELKNLTKRGIKVEFIPRIVDNELIEAFRYVDGNVTLKELIKKSTDLINYRKGSFEYIYKKYDEIMNKL